MRNGARAETATVTDFVNTHYHLEDMREWLSMNVSRSVDHYDT